MSIELYTHGQLTFITTDNCTADCPHCLMHARPGKKHALSFEQMKKSIDEFREHSPLYLVIFTGGEPTLLGETLFRAIRYCTELGILTRIVTNCHWARTEESTSRMLTKLREAGLREINFSMDDYHAPYVPIEYLRRAWKTTKGMGFSAVVIANCHGETDQIDPDFIQNYFGETIFVRDADHRKQRGKLERPDEFGTLYIIAEGRLQKSGRAIEEISEDERYYKAPEERLQGGCANLLNECAISYENKLWVCCGIQSEKNPILCVGDLNEMSLDEALKKGQDSVIINAIHTIGPYNLLRLLLQMDPTLPIQREYHSICEICELITTEPRAVATLRKAIPALAVTLRSYEGGAE